MTFQAPNKFRVREGPYGTTDDLGNCGAFLLPSVIPGRPIYVISSDELGWEHVSVSVAQKKISLPTWLEMGYVKDAFWGDEDVVLQFHPKKSEYVNNHPGCLHLWRPIGVEFPTPPPSFVGKVGATPEEVKRLAKEQVEALSVAKIEDARSIVIVSDPRLEQLDAQHRLYRPNPRGPQT